MKKLAIVLSIILCAAMANAAVIQDIQVNGLYTEGDIVTVPGAIVTVAAYNGVWVADGAFGPGDGIWVYLGSHTFVPGDILDITADYVEYFELSELDAGGWDDVPATDTVVHVGTTTPLLPLQLTAAVAMANAELYEGNFIQLVDGFQVNALLAYGEWTARSNDLITEIHFDDLMFDETGLAVDDCFNDATGAWHYSFGAYKLLPIADGLVEVECAVATDEVTFGAIKTLYR